MNYVLLALLAVLDFEVEPRGRFIPGVYGHAEYPVAKVTITAMLKGEPTEADYCAWVEVRWPGDTGDTVSTEQEDCPPWEEWQKQLKAEADCLELTVVPAGQQSPECPMAFQPQRRWSWTRVFIAGEWEIPVDLYVGTKRVRRAVAHFVVTGDRPE